MKLWNILNMCVEETSPPLSKNNNIYSTHPSCRFYIRPLHTGFGLNHFKTEYYKLLKKMTTLLQLALVNVCIGCYDVLWKSLPKGKWTYGVLAVCQR
mmetsp:Transcript_34475/g.70520  ORF Transcript_34475/g.70520 Transcript_34475/m.70520 type:complete len:97 (-) Transcript_34475:189-479(-)